MTDDDSSAFEHGGGADASTDDGTGSREDVDETFPDVDEGLQDVVEYELADLEEADAAEAEDEPAYPSMDDPVSSQSIDVENAAFVVLGVLAMVGLFLHLLLGVF